MSKTSALLHSASSSLPSSQAYYWKIAHSGERRYPLWAWEGTWQGSRVKKNQLVLQMAAREAKWKCEEILETKGGPCREAEGKICCEAGAGCL